MAILINIYEIKHVLALLQFDSKCPKPGRTTCRNQKRLRRVTSPLVISARPRPCVATRARQQAMNARWRCVRASYQLLHHKGV